MATLHNDLLDRVGSLYKELESPCAISRAELQDRSDDDLKILIERLTKELKRKKKFDQELQHKLRKEAIPDYSRLI